VGNSRTHLSGKEKNEIKWIYPKKSRKKKKNQEQKKGLLKKSIFQSKIKDK